MIHLATCFDIPSWMLLLNVVSCLGFALQYFIISPSFFVLFCPFFGLKDPFTFIYTDNICIVLLISPQRLFCMLFLLIKFFLKVIINKLNFDLVCRWPFKLQPMRYAMVLTSSCWAPSSRKWKKFSCSLTLKMNLRTLKDWRHVWPAVGALWTV